MIKNIIFDFGDIFINLDKEIVFKEMGRYGSIEPSFELLQLCSAFEVGNIEANEFTSSLQSFFPTATSKQIEDVWNSMILDFPDYRLDFIEALANDNNYRMFLLSNNNALHLQKAVEIMGNTKYTRFKNCFERFYLSHEIQLRKPDNAIYQFVLDENDLLPSETFFVDDTKENTDAAKALGIKTWNLIVGKEDIIHLKSKL